ncbi:hypothetical protein [Candidatus Enterovibrio escicola]|uniref:hypothetical protein n=1 Tax=Candidatus Enterovibrio escicola TaxID=1927127 RepID=UPI0012383024|nr:hypothetical protein [Candidatus Enterovibrio escacola]
MSTLPRKNTTVYISRLEHCKDFLKSAHPLNDFQALSKRLRIAGEAKAIENKGSNGYFSTTATLKIIKNFINFTYQHTFQGATYVEQ